MSTEENNPNADTTGIFNTWFVTYEESQGIVWSNVCTCRSGDIGRCPVHGAL